MRGSSLAQALACAALLFTSAASLGQHTCTFSESDPRYFRWFSDPELYVFARPDPVLLDQLSTSCRKKVLARVRKIRGNGASHHLLASRLNGYAGEADTRNAIADAYTTELRLLLGSGGPFDVPSELRVGRDVLEALHPLPPDQGRLLARFLASVFRDSNRPLITFEAGVPTDAIAAFRSALAEHGVRCLIGSEFTPQQSADATRVDYIVCAPEAFPPSYRDQAAVSYARAVAGEKPVMFRIKKPRFYPEFFWLATGAAGIRYDFEESLCASEVERSFAYVRGLATVFRVGRFRPLYPDADSQTRGSSMAFQVLNFPAKFILPTEPTFTWQTRLPIEETNVYPFWVDIATDVFVENAPILKCVKEVTITEQLPTKGRPFAFGFVHIPTGDDRQTTIGPITPLEGELEAYAAALAEQAVKATSSTVSPQ